MNSTQDMNFDLGLPITDLPQTNNCIIKVIGVGGGGCNAVNHMYREGIHDVSYVVCNTDKKSLNDSPVPNHLQLGDGLGAGNRPEKAKLAAENSMEAIKEMLRVLLPVSAFLKPSALGKDGCQDFWGLRF